jgi:hypothetical protein
MIIVVGSVGVLADMHLRLALSRVSASWLQSQITTHVSTFTKAMWVFQRQQKRQRDQRAYSLDLLQLRHLRVTLLCQILDALVVLHHALAQRLDCVQQWFQCGLQFRTQALGFLRIQIAHVCTTLSVALMHRDEKQGRAGRVSEPQAS